MINFNTDPKELLELLEKLQSVPSMSKEEAEAFQKDLETNPKYEMIRDMQKVFKKYGKGIK